MEKNACILRAGLTNYLYYNKVQTVKVPAVWALIMVPELDVYIYIYKEFLESLITQAAWESSNIVVV